MLEAIVQIRSEESIKLIRGQRGSYGWEIKVASRYLGPASIERLERLDKQLQASFIGNEKPKEVKGAVQKREAGGK